MRRCLHIWEGVTSLGGSASTWQREGGITRSRVENWQRLDFFFFRLGGLWVYSIQKKKPVDFCSNSVASPRDSGLPVIFRSRHRHPLFFALPRLCNKSAARTKLRPQGILPRREDSGWLAVVVSPQTSLPDHVLVHTYADDITSASWQDEVPLRIPRDHAMTRRNFIFHGVVPAPAPGARRADDAVPARPLHIL